MAERQKVSERNNFNMVKKENTHADGDEDIASQEGSESGSDYDNSEDGSSDLQNSKQNSLTKKGSALNKPKTGGVLHGNSKKMSNAISTNVTANMKANKAMIKTGSVAMDDLQKKRTKERTITEIIEKVSTWRKLYNGVMIPNKDTNEVQLQRWSLEDAAAKVKVSKKSLDDYLL